MGGRHRARAGRDPARLIAPAALALLVGCLAASPDVLGAFTDTKQVTANAFTTGTVNLASSPASGFISLSMMSPGDVVTAPVTVSNTGATALRYAVTSTTSENSLAGQLDLYIKSGVTTCTTAGFGASGSVIYNNTSRLGSTSGVNVVGDPGQGAQAGDRPLAAGVGEALCFQVSMPSAITSTYQGLTVTATFTFQAEQVANN
jgi:predicted ribosomally synthesized peptide with SipW-like signal peptide